MYGLWEGLTHSAAVILELRKTRNAFPCHPEELRRGIAPFDRLRAGYSADSIRNDAKGASRQHYCSGTPPGNLGDAECMALGGSDEFGRSPFRAEQNQKCLPCHPEELRRGIPLDLKGIMDSSFQSDNEGMR